MNLKQARQEVNNHKSIKGKNVNDAEVTHVGIVPTDKDVLAQIVNCILQDYDYEYLLEGSTEFEILVFFEEYEGIVTYMPLTAALGRLQD